MATFIVSHTFLNNLYKKNLLSKCITKLYNLPVRHRRYRIKESRFLGYYERKIPLPVYEARKQIYRETILKPMDEMLSLQQRLEQLDVKDPVLDATVDIGLSNSAYKKEKLSVKERLNWQKEMKSNIEIVKLARSKSLKLDLDKVHFDWKTSSGPLQLQVVANHYGIFKHLFDHGYFTPWIPLHVFHDYNDEFVSPAHMGNIVESIEAAKVPSVHISSDANDLWTLVLTNLDGHLLDTNSEYLHWFVANIKGDDVASGEVICDYLRPFPFRGTGYHRMVYVLYKQDQVIDFSALKKESPCLCLKERTFRTFDFYKKHQDVLTPAGLAFYQCTWDPSLTNFFHHTLNMQEPVFEYHQDPMYHTKQVQYPEDKPFNLYLDRYRDPKDFKKEVLLKRLKTINPFEEEPPMPKYPCLHKPIQRIWSWQREDIDNERLRLGKYRDLRPHSVYPQEDDQGKYSHKN